MVRVCEGVKFAFPFHQDEHLHVRLNTNFIAPEKKIIPRLAKLFRFVPLVHGHGRVQCQK
jgi:hypothetical protein